MTFPQLLSAGAIFGVFIVMVLALTVQSARRALAELQIRELELDLAKWRRRDGQFNAKSEALRVYAHETALFARLAVEMGLPLPDAETDDTLPRSDTL